VRRAIRLLVVATLTLFAGCAAAPPFDPVAIVKEWQSFMNSSYEVRPGDVVRVSVYQEADLDQEATVTRNGTLFLKRVPEEIKAIGKPMSQLRRDIQAAYGKVLVEPEVSVSLASGTESSIYVMGEVDSPGAFAYRPGMLLSQALSEAGGLEITAKWNDVRVLRNNGKSARTIRVNANSILFEGSTDFVLLPGDVVMCQTSAIADVGNWVELWIRRLLPFPISGFAIPIN
jgi:polysaccharide export outer membrane protein